MLQESPYNFTGKEAVAGEVGSAAGRPAGNVQALPLADLTALCPQGSLLPL